MNKKLLIETANALMAGDKGLLAMDESNDTCNKRFAQAGIPQTEAARRDWRELIATTPDLRDSINCAILYDETINQSAKDGRPIIKIIVEAGIIPGIKVDTGAKAMPGFPGEKITEGLDGLRERLSSYYKTGARFAKWRSSFAINAGMPSVACMEANAHALARYAALCQELDIVPIVEPEVLMEGMHDLPRCYDVTLDVLRTVFNRLFQQKVLLEGMILKPNMVTPGLQCTDKVMVDEVADATIACLLQSVPAAVAGIAFLSGGQSGELASAHLNAMHIRHTSKLPWPLTFSFARAIQQPAMDLWHGQESNIRTAQRALYHRAQCDKAARRGEYNVAQDRAFAHL